jgi:hypothetical protein
MKGAWKNVPQAEQSCQKCEHKQQKKKDQNELHEMIMKEVQHSMQTMFKQMQQYIPHLGMEKVGVAWSVCCSTSICHTNGILWHECRRFSIIHGIYTPFGNGEGQGCSVQTSFNVRPSHQWNFLE